MGPLFVCWEVGHGVVWVFHVKGGLFVEVDGTFRTVTAVAFLVAADTVLFLTCAGVSSVVVATSDADIMVNQTVPR